MYWVILLTVIYVEEVHSRNVSDNGTTPIYSSIETTKESVPSTY